MLDTKKQNCTKNADGVMDVRVVSHTTKIVSDVVKSLNGTDTIFCQNTGLVRMDQISPANADQISTVKAASQAAQNMLKAGENLVDSLQEPEYV